MSTAMRTSIYRISAACKPVRFKHDKHTKAFSFIVYPQFEAITQKKASFDRYRKIELALATPIPGGFSSFACHVAATCAIPEPKAPACLHSHCAWRRFVWLCHAILKAIRKSNDHSGDGASRRFGATTFRAYRGGFEVRSAIIPHAAPATWAIRATRYHGRTHVCGWLL